MFSAFSTALSALNATSVAVDVTGNNLANLNTVGFKASDVTFYDLVNQAISGNGSSAGAGFGVAPPTITQVYSQGSPQSSAGPLDGAIQGNGFFVLRDNNNNQLFTRNGNFTVDSSGNLLTGTGEHVQGWANIGGALNTNSVAGDIVLPTGTLRSPKATTNFTTQVNLNAAAAVGSADGSFSQPMVIYDSLGAQHTLTVSFTKSGTNAWNYAITIPGADQTSGTPGTSTSLATGSLTFDSQGNLLTPAPPPPAANAVVPVSITGLASGAADMTVNWNLYDPTTFASNITQLAQPNAPISNSQDGTASAQLVSVTMVNGGQILATYSNAQSQIVGQVALAGIRNPESLVGAGNSNLKLSANSGIPSIGTAGTGGRGTVLGGSLESSTVDIAREFTNLIVFQRSYQANAKVITAADQLTQDTINLKQ